MGETRFSIPDRKMYAQGFCRTLYYLVVDFLRRTLYQSLDKGSGFLAGKVAYLIDTLGNVCHIIHETQFFSSARSMLAALRVKVGVVISSFLEVTSLS